MKNRIKKTVATVRMMTKMKTEKKKTKITKLILIVKRKTTCKEQVKRAENLRRAWLKRSQEHSKISFDENRL